MSSLEEFGPYLLLKKLNEDPLGEVFRAGKLGSQGVEQVVLLRIFNGRTINGLHLWQAIKGRAAVQQALKSPNVGNGVGLGEDRGVPYAAYDYISGKSLANLLVQASTENTPIPSDHALLIAERLALALSMAYEARSDGERILHGFVAPQLVMISNEGETRLLGFEVAPGLRDLATSGSFGADVTRYLAPKALTSGPVGGAVDRADDVFSLGVILFELLTCAPLPRPRADGFAAVVDAAEISQEGVPLPPNVKTLLKKSLAPRAQRIPDALSWHKAVTKLLVDGGFSATTFNLAFFMHNLFRNEIERESQEIEAEKTIEIPTAVIAASAAPAAAAREAARPAATAAVGRPAAGEDTASRQRGHAVDRTAKSSGKGLWVGLAAALVVALVGAGGYYYYFLRAKPEAGTPVEPSPQTATAGETAPPPLVEPAETAPPAPTGPTPEELQAQLAKMIDARSAEMEAKLKAQYDARIKLLQDQLQSTQEAGARREAELREQQRRAAEAIATEEVAAKQTPPAAAAPVVKPPPATTTPAGATTPAETARQAGDTAAATKPPAGQPAPSTTGATSTQPTNARSVEPPPAAEPKVRVGDLVSMGAGVKPPELVRMPDPTFPTIAKRLNKSAVVEVRVLVDEKGEVQQTEITGKKGGFGFDQAALEAARRAAYKPATKDGVRVKMWTLLKVRFEQ